MVQKENVIDTAANRQMSFLKEYQAGERSELTQRLLNELAAARLCLLNKEKKAVYDEKLRASLKAGESPTRPPPLGRGRRSDGPTEDTTATREHEAIIPLRVPMTAPIAAEPVLPPVIETRPAGPNAEGPFSPPTPVFSESPMPATVGLSETPRQPGPSNFVFGIAVGLMFAAIAVLLALWAASLLGTSRSLVHQTAQPEGLQSPPAAESIAKLPRNPQPDTPAALQEDVDQEPSSKGDTSPAKQPAPPDSLRTAPSVRPAPAEKANLLEASSPSQPPPIAPAGPKPSAAEPASPPPAPAGNAAHSPPVAETLEQAEQRLNAQAAQASTGETQQEKAREATKLADRATVDSKTDLAKRLAALALKLASKSSSASLIDDGTMRMMELGQPITDALRDKAKQQLDRPRIPAAPATTSEGPPLAIAPFDESTAKQHQLAWAEYLQLEFCRKLSSLVKEQAAGRVYRLPTEAEWE